MNLTTLLELRLPVTVAFAAIAALGYMVSRFRQREHEAFTLLDGLMLVLLMAIATATGIPLVEAATQSAKVVVLRDNLQTLRTQVEAYKIQHHGEPPVLYQGGFPQLFQATDAEGVPGPVGGKHPFGPYLRIGLPTNPLTGQVIVTPTKEFPPVAASGNGGWLYHQPTGQIAPDLPGMLSE